MASPTKKDSKKPPKTTGAKAATETSSKIAPSSDDGGLDDQPDQSRNAEQDRVESEEEHDRSWDDTPSPATHGGEADVSHNPISGKSNLEKLIYMVFNSQGPSDDDKLCIPDLEADLSNLDFRRKALLFMQHFRAVYPLVQASNLQQLLVRGDSLAPELELNKAKESHDQDKKDTLKSLNAYQVPPILQVKINQSIKPDGPSIQTLELLADEWANLAGGVEDLQKAAYETAEGFISRHGYKNPTMYPPGGAGSGLRFLGAEAEVIQPQDLSFPTLWRRTKEPVPVFLQRYFFDLTREAAGTLVAETALVGTGNPYLLELYMARGKVLTRIVRSCAYTWQRWRA